MLLVRNAALLLSDADRATLLRILVGVNLEWQRQMPTFHAIDHLRRFTSYCSAPQRMHAYSRASWQVPTCHWQLSNRMSYLGVQQYGTSDSQMVLSADRGNGMEDWSAVLANAETKWIRQATLGQDTAVRHVATYQMRVIQYYTYSACTSQSRSR